MASQQQPPARPWFRLSSMARPAAPAPAPAPAPPAAAAAPPPAAPVLRPTFVRPTFTQTTQPPPPPAAATITSSVPSSPIIRTSTPSSPKPPQTFTTTTTLPIDSSSLPPSPKTRTSVPSSPLTAPPAPKPVSSYSAPPPSPSPQPITALTTTVKHHTPPSSPRTQQKSSHDHQSNFPPEAEQKTVLVQETTEKPKMMPRTFNWDQQRHVSENQTKDIKAKDHKKQSDSEEYGARIITIAGENKGAIMELKPHSYKKNGFTGKPRTLREKSAIDNREKSAIDSSSNSSSDEEGRKKNKDGMGMTSSPPLNAFMNSNVQGVNNSILYNCSCTHHDPGIHLSLSKKTNGSVKDQNI